eukprot:GILI01018446.1.p1 GENE.GILI01018446.1~~GILI01018446.1.p1  ORF type:complete len:365 (-),score=82.95 GILI01018446.1:71-1165(-)
MSKRPEHENPPDIYYNDENAKKYHINSRIRNIQRKLTERAIELLQLPAGQPCHILDLGCGTGLSGEVLSEQGHSWVGMDISRSMLDICKNREFQESDEDEDDDVENENDDDEVNEGDEAEEEEDEADPGHQERSKWREVMHGDMGNGVPFRPGVFDGVVSISVVQWLCNIDKKGQVPQKRLRELFQTLYNSMRRGAKAVLQFYPESPQQMNLISQAAMKCGFGGGMVVDFPHSTRAKKYFLVIYAGSAGSGGYVPPAPLTGNASDDDDEYTDEEYSGEEYEEEEEQDQVSRGPMKLGNRARVDGRDRRNKHAAAAADRKKRRKDNRPVTGTKEWVLMKKGQRRSFGVETRPDTKYTMRRRKPKF